jgi:hypothetical protein
MPQERIELHLGVSYTLKHTPHDTAVINSLSGADRLSDRLPKSFISRRIKKGKGKKKSFTR